ncbi:hypothetical protein L6164_011238 [Bauhinia variegata]|uniref:Uncharacterized protein n=1 Tax=Bauhinia variegata TaxID=167791 RepID=A0ACB9P936_BAUVA|nr:hypothetical protein L6164_011238 [Bauhinia variegata]
MTSRRIFLGSKELLQQAGNDVDPDSSAEKPSSEDVLISTRHIFKAKASQVIPLSEQCPRSCIPLCSVWLPRKMGGKISEIEFSIAIHGRRAISLSMPVNLNFTGWKSKRTFRYLQFISASSLDESELAWKIGYRSEEGV